MGFGLSLRRGSDFGPAESIAMGVRTLAPHGGSDISPAYSIVKGFGLQLVREMQKDLADDDYTSAVRLGESWVNLLPAILTLLRTVQNAGVFIAKYVGGVKLSRAWRTQQSPSPMPVQFVDSTLQRSALGNITWIVTESVNPGTPGLFPSATVFQKLLKRNGTSGSQPLKIV